MKLETRTIQVLKNFSSINQSLLFTKGKTLTTVSPQKTTIAKANIKEEIPTTFAIYEISKFLGVLTLFDTPDIEIEDKQAVIKAGQQKVQYTFADPRMIVSPSDKLLSWLENDVPEPEVTFRVTSDILQNVFKAMGVLQLPEFAITGEDGSLFVEGIDSKNPSENNYRLEVGSTEYTFRSIFKFENMKLISGDYTIGVCSTGLGVFEGNDVSYWITSEANSYFRK